MAGLPTKKDGGISPGYGYQREVEARMVNYRGSQMGGVAVNQPRKENLPAFGVQVSFAIRVIKDMLKGRKQTKVERQQDKTADTSGR